MNLRLLLEGMETSRVYGPTDIEISGISCDSREVKGDFLFCAVPGAACDGHTFVEDAVRSGATVIVCRRDPEIGPRATVVIVPCARRALAVLSDKWYGHPSRDLKLVGITGTNGKTTTNFLCEAILARAGFKTGLIGTIRYQIGKEVFPAKNTTPESLHLQALLAKMRESEVKAVAMEVSSHALDQERVHGCEFDAAIFTNLTRDHLDYHKDMDSYREAKLKLFSGLSSRYKPNVAAIINKDDPASVYFSDVCKTTLWTFGIREESLIRAVDVRLSPSGVSYKALTPSGETGLQLHLTGFFNVYNSLAALSFGLSQGFPLPLIKDAIENVRGVDGRFEVVQDKPFSVIVDYAHTPDGLENVLRTAVEICPGRKIVIFGCGGDRDRTKRPMMGRVAAQYGDFCIITSDNPRTEEPIAIIREIEVGFKEGQRFRGNPTVQYCIEPDRRKAIQLGIETAEEGDLVLIAGKGHEDYQIFRDRTIRFDDRQVAREALENCR